MGDLPASLIDWIRALPKAELHLHLDGSMRPATALELARTRRPSAIDVPANLATMRARLVAPAHSGDQARLLRAFDLPVALLQDAEALERCALELVEDVASDGTRYAEIRWAPALHTSKGLSLEDVISAVVRGVRAASRRLGTEVRLIAVVLRTHPPDVAVEVARASLAALPDGLTGFDLAGPERQAPDPRPFRQAFDLARAGGLGITCHAGEWGGPAQVRSALALDPWRIAHGAPAADDPELMAELRRRGVTLDLCPTSNRQAGIGNDDAEAPLPRLLRHAVPVTISTDDRTISDLTLVDEMERAVTRLGLTPSDLVTVTRRAYAAAFLHHDEDLRARLVDALEGWLEQHPVPG